MKKFWTLRYTLINVLYFAAFCTIHAYAGVFLLDKGFTNTQVGFALAASNILSVIGQPVVAGFIDKSKRLTNRIVVMAASALLLLGALSLLILNSQKIAILIIFVLMYTIQFVYMPIMIAMNFEYQSAGCKINFGLARGMGSAGFAVTSAFIGKSVELNGTNVLLYVTMIVMALMFAVVFFFKKPDNTAEEDNGKEEAANNNLFAFIKQYPKFMLFLLGSACCFFAHNMLNDFLIQIIRSLGGNETHMGYATFLQAILELPVMAFIGLVLKKISTKAMLIFASVAFTAKTFIMFISTGLAGMYISQSFQLFAYAVFIPTAALYADKVMKKNDRVKGQAYINCAITLGGVFSNLVCGKLLDEFGVGTMLMTGIIVSAIGVVITVTSMIDKKAKA